MESNPALTPKSTTVLKAAERSYSDYLALKRSVCDMQEGDTPARHGGGTAAGAAGSTTGAALGPTAMLAGARLPYLQFTQGAGISQLVPAQGQAVLLPPAALAAQQLQAARPVMLAPLSVLGGGVNPQLLAAAGIAGPAATQAAFLLQQQRWQQALAQQQQQQLMQHVLQGQLLAQGQQQQQQQNQQLQQDHTQQHQQPPGNGV
jgi:hypothetical protein